MEKSSPLVRVMPDFRSARILGLFNVVFAAQILLCGLCMGGYVATLPLWGRAMQQVQSQAKSQIDAQRDTQRKALEEDEKKAKTVDEKADILSRRKLLAGPQQATVALSMDFTKMGFTDPTTIAWSWVEVVSGLVLNVLMLASGIGLMHWRPWAWKLGIWTAALKLLRLLFLYGAFIIAVVPPMSRNLGEMVGEMTTQQQAAMGRQGAAVPTEIFVRIYTVTYTIMGVGIIVIGSVYPAIALWVLARPGVRSACSGRFVLPKEPNQP